MRHTSDRYFTERAQPSSMFGQGNQSHLTELLSSALSPELE